MTVAPLSATARAWLLGRARQAIAARLGGSVLPAGTAPAECEEPRACFVSLHSSDGGLRGCIGMMEAAGPLRESVERMAVAAAVSDPRFAPLRAEELASCVLEISVLTPRVAARVDEVEVGRHGVAVACRGRRAVLLPQVAPAHGWDRDTLLDHVCAKAGLPRDAWRTYPDLTLEVFEAEVFGE